MAEQTAIQAAMIEVMRRVRPVAKDRTNPEQRYQYRGIDDVYEALHGIMAEVGVFTTSSVIEPEYTEGQTQRGTWLGRRAAVIEYSFHASDGSTVSTQVMAEGFDTSDKASNKLMSGAHKSALLQIFMIPTGEGADSEAESPEPAPRVEQRAGPAADELVRQFHAELVGAPHVPAAAKRGIYNKVVRALEEARAMGATEAEVLQDVKQALADQRMALAAMAKEAVSVPDEGTASGPGAE